MTGMIKMARVKGKSVMTRMTRMHDPRMAGMMTAITRSTKITRRTGLTGKTGVIWMTGMTRVTRMIRIT